MMMQPLLDYKAIVCDKTLLFLLQYYFEFFTK